MSEINWKEITIIICNCGFRLGVQNIHLEEVSAGVWGTIKCLKCQERLNDKIYLAWDKLKNGQK